MRVYLPPPTKSEDWAGPRTGFELDLWLPRGSVRGRAGKVQCGRSITRAEWGRGGVFEAVIATGIARHRFVRV